MKATIRTRHSQKGVAMLVPGVIVAVIVFSSILLGNFFLEDRQDNKDRPATGAVSGHPAAERTTVTTGRPAEERETRKKDTPDQRRLTYTGNTRAADRTATYEELVADARRKHREAKEVRERATRAIREDSPNTSYSGKSTLTYLDSQVTDSSTTENADRRERDTDGDPENSDPPLEDPDAEQKDHKDHTEELNEEAWPLPDCPWALPESTSEQELKNLFAQHGCTYGYFCREVSDDAEASLCWYGFRKPRLGSQ